MSWETSTHALGLTLGSATRKLVLMGYANHAHKDGTAAFPSIATVAEYAECDPRTAQRHVKWLVEHGYMREGNQLLVASYPKNKRPFVYDIAMDEPTRMEWEAYHATGGNALREAATAAGERAAHAKVQVSGGDILSPASVASTGPESGGDILSPAAWGDTSVPSGVTDQPFRGDTGVTQTTQEPPQGTVPSSSSEPLRASDEEREPEPVSEKNDRADVTRLCEFLAERMVANGCKRPTITNRWRDAARLLMDADGRTERQVRNMIEWATGDEFWRANILSMPTLREKYDAMRLRAEADYAKREQAAATPRRGDIDWTAAMERAEQMDDQLGLGGTA